jgi:hypothetical protein
MVSKPIYSGLDMDMDKATGHELSDYRIQLCGLSDQNPLKTTEY